MTKPKNITVSIQMAREDYQKLYKFSEKKGQPKTKTIREALERYYSDEKIDVIDNDSQPMLPGIEEESDTKEDHLEFYGFIDDGKRGRIRLANILVKHGVTSIKIFAERDPLEFIKFKWIGTITMPYILEKHAEARKIFGLDPIEEPSLNDISEKLKEKQAEAINERKRRWNEWWEQYHEPRTVESLLKHAAATENPYRISK